MIENYDNQEENYLNNTFSSQSLNNQDENYKIQGYLSDENNSNMNKVRKNT